MIAFIGYNLCYECFLKFCVKHYNYRGILKNVCLNMIKNFEVNSIKSNKINSFKINNFFCI